MLRQHGTRWLQKLRGLSTKPDFDRFDEFSRYTSGRWVGNERQQMALRYTPFDLNAISKIAAKACKANAVKSMTKMPEGLFNRCFHLVFDTGDEAVLRIKTPIAGVSHFTTASEVATMEYLRTRCQVPVPKVFAWSSRAAEDGAGVEYILMEKASGAPLRRVWHDIKGKERASFVKKLIDVEQKMLAPQFKYMGSLFFRGDIDSELAATSLYGHASEDDKVFCIGPTVQRDFWEDERASMALDRGPWLNSSEYLEAIVAREESWINTFAITKRHRLHDDPFRELPGQGQTIEEHLSLLSQYRLLIPGLVPLYKPLALIPTLWHPDLNLGNIFVGHDNNGGPFISSIIDWQGTWIGPRYLQVMTPAFIQYRGENEIPPGLTLVKRPEDLDSLSPKERESIMQDYRARLLHQLYYAQQIHGMGVKFRDQLVQLSQSVGLTWRNGIIPLKDDMLTFRPYWEHLHGGSRPFPLPDLSEEENEAHEKDRLLWENCQSMLKMMETELGVGAYGTVSNGAYSQVLVEIEDLKQRIWDSEIREDMKDFFRTHWPWRDTLDNDVA